MPGYVQPVQQWLAQQLKAEIFETMPGSGRVKDVGGHPGVAGQFTDGKSVVL